MFTPEQNQQIKAIQIVAAALMLGVLFFIAMALIVINFVGFQTDTVLFLPLLIISIAMLANIPLGFVLYKSVFPLLPERQRGFSARSCICNLTLDFIPGNNQFL